MAVSFSIADSSRGGRTYVLWVRGRLDAPTARTLVGRLSQADRDQRTSVVLDMTGVTAVEPTGLAALTEVGRTMKGLARLKVVAPPPEVVEMFRNAAVDELIEVVPPRSPKDRRRSDAPVAVEQRTGLERRRLAPTGSPVRGPMPPLPFSAPRP